MTRVMLALVGAAALVFSCDGKFEFGDEGVTGTGGEAPGGPDCHECGECEECEQLGLVCDRGGFPCVECLNDEHCNDNSRPRCDKALRRCVGCDQLGNCKTAGLTCDLVTHSCVIGCAVDDMALTCDRDFSYCDEQYGVCAICASDRDCEFSPAGPYCVESGTRCVECRRKDHCADGKVCDPVLFRCVECSDWDDCGHGEQCDLRTHECVEILEPAQLR